MWAYADPRDVVDAHIRVRGARLFALMGSACLLRVFALSAPKSFRLWVFGRASRPNARAVPQALEKEDPKPFDNYIIVQETTRLDKPTAPLLKQRFGTPEQPDGPPGAAEIEGHGSVFSTAKIQRELGWRPRYNWRSGAKL